jgi:hypothetical protein
MGSILSIGYKRKILNTFMAITINIEMVALKKKLSGNCIAQIIARIIATTLQRKIQTMKMGIKLLGASFLASVIKSLIPMFLKNFEIIIHKNYKPKIVKKN